MTSCLLSALKSPSEKGVYSKRKELGANSFLFEQKSFQKGGKTILTRIYSLESVSIPLDTQ